MGYNYFDDDCLTESQVEKKAKQLKKISESSNCLKVERDDQNAIFYFKNKQIFRCKGPLVDIGVIINKNKKILW